ncbi:hypothetical protein WJX84_009587 [Apatococcus fuscideae]|uniref:Uncharacterized protein n=1 Tax=Apatococcus fuscideae TaxID=2026836 RepID=A0AAW1SYJ0_9CHLO
MWPAHQKGDQPSYLSNDLTERHVPLSGVPVASPARSMGGMGSSMASMSPGMSQLVSPARISDSSDIGSMPYTDCILRTPDGTDFPVARSMLMLESQVFRYVWLSKGQIEHLMGLSATKASMDALGPLPRWQACQELDRSSNASGVTQNLENPCTHHTPELAP